MWFALVNESLQQAQEKWKFSLTKTNNNSDKLTIKSYMYPTSCRKKLQENSLTNCHGKISHYFKFHEKNDQLMWPILRL